MTIKNNNAKFRKSGLGCLISVTLMLSVSQTASAASASATVSAEIVKTMTVNTQTGIGFGNISTGTEPGKVTISPGGEISYTGGVISSSATPGSPASFKVEGEPNATYSVTLPQALILTDGASNTMVVDSFTASPNIIGIIDSNGTKDLFVGATLNVNANQPLGTYSELMSISVDYN